MACTYIKLIGRLGNQMFQYAYAKAYCERVGHILVTDPWVGQRLFDIHDPTPDSMRTLSKGVLEGYFQDQSSMIYTRSQAKRWFTIRPEIQGFLNQHIKAEPVLCHRRVGDYANLSYVVVSLRSYWDAIVKYGYPLDQAAFVTEENPVKVPGFPEDLMFFVDFYRLMQAFALFRGNSSFSWWAATLASKNQKIYSPVVEGKPSGERDCEFVEGNHPRFCDLEFVTDLHLKP